MLSRLYKLIFDLSICCCLGAFLLHFFGGVTLQVGGFLILLVAAALTLVMREKGRQSILFMVILPAIGGLFLRPALNELLIYIPVWGYGLYLLVSDRLVVGRGDFLDRVRHVIILFLVLPLFMLVELHAVGDALRAALPYLVFTIISIIFMLRHLRTQHLRVGQKGYYSQQRWELIIFLFVCMLLTLVRAPQNLFVGIQLLFGGVIQPLLALFGSLVAVILGPIINGILSLLNIRRTPKEGGPQDDEMYGRMKDIPDLKEVFVPNSAWIMPLLYSFGVILGLVVLFFLLRWLIGDKGKHKLPTGVSEIREALEEPNEGRNKRRWKNSKEPAERIRYYYMKYLLHLRLIKLSTLPGDTTREVDHKYSDLLDDNDIEQREASKQLKRLYRKARYQHHTDMKNEEAEQAKKLYHTIKAKRRIN